MRESRKCIKCDCRKLFVLDPVQTEDPSTSWGVKPMPITVSMVQGRITAGSIEVWLCSRCGYMEWYAKDTEGALEHFSKSPKDSGVRFVDGDDSDSPYR